MAVSDEVRLPRHWQAYVDPELGIPYYYNEATKESLWEPPPGSSGPGSAAPEPEQSGEREQRAGSSKSGRSSSSVDTENGKAERDTRSSNGERESGKAERDCRVRADNLRTAGDEAEEPVCFLRGLPWKAKHRDIISFFGPFGLQIARDGVHIVLNADGRPSGDGFVVFDSLSDANHARHKYHKEYMGSRFVEIFASTLREMRAKLEPQELAMGRQRGGPGPGPGPGGRYREWEGRNGAPRNSFSLAGEAERRGARPGDGRREGHGWERGGERDWHEGKRFRGEGHGAGFGWG